MSVEVKGRCVCVRWCVSGGGVVVCVCEWRGGEGEGVCVCVCVRWWRGGGPGGP